MKRNLLLLCLVLLHTVVFAQTAPSPKQFLGYEPGAAFTPHYKIAGYFKAVANAVPNMVKVESYGETYEKRELLVAYIATPENLQRLEAIRNNNLQQAGIKSGGAPLADAPVIVWLSYNVHGNEPSSSEAAMKTLYALVDPSNAQTKQWLKNTVVIIDPCINPDGRDRYVNWFNSVVGKTYNADPQSREHNEPWPGGRTNHYNFDMNRDWAWQTQKETVQRMKKYNEWLPQIHVDFHEQGYNAPYYFAPAAEPYHEVITPWQRQFQVEVGRNNAKYFDKNGWLYFTRERFDLFYPSYGDTYPLYNGAIGMTYEQGGHSRGGLAVVKSDEDTLTLTDRVEHHYTTSLATVETASLNAAKLLKEYKQFFDDNIIAKNAPYKTYVLTSKDINQLQTVAELLDKNGITYGTLGNKTFKALNYFTGKEENYKDEGYSLAVSAAQPRGTLLRVLFEPKSLLSDSITYDITAWAIPYSFNIKGYAVKEKLAIDAFPKTNVPTVVSSSYGVLIPYSSVKSVQLLSYLLTKKVKVRYAEKAFTYKGKEYSRGTLIVLKGGNIDEWNTQVNTACQKFNIQAEIVESGFMDKGADFGSPDIHLVHAPNVVLLTGEETSSSAAGEVWSFFDQTLNYPLTLINAGDIGRVNLKDYDVVILPDGYYRSLKKSNDALKSFVEGGGKLIAMENAVSVLSELDWGIKKKDKDKDKDAKDDKNTYVDLKKYSERERDEMPNAIPGAIYKIDLDETHPLAYGYNDYYTLKQDGTAYEFLKDGWNVGVIKKENYIAGFVGSKLKPKLQDGLVFGVQDMGRGTVVYLADDPLFRLFWEGGKLMFSNAVFLVGE
ncbi:MAG: zinc carboxypeptidase [Filimonas sp.]|nr:zinc carboxypeptidase [Filimonas sp.]